ncbi:MAG: hypothetical protein GZ093_12130 [Rhodoferax sp.]|nr:Mov34/MPN/PAD-1 family protein [Rhodoferax sp.]NDP39480.1 hypothetical protein [Rhodoferax sp.]
MPGFTQVVRIGPTAIQHVRKHRQIRPQSSEAGGQLFGSITTDEVTISVATGLYKNDGRGRYHYRSNPEAAQSAIERHARTGHLYLGDWHTHAESVPQTSLDDVDAMARLVAKSALNSDAILMLIVGQSEGIDGLRLKTVGRFRSDDWVLLQVTGSFGG